MNINKLNDLMRVGLTDDQFEIIDKYISELLKERDEALNNNNNIKHKKMLCGKLEDHSNRFNQMVFGRKGEVFVLDELNDFIGSRQEGKSYIAEHYMKMYKDFYGVGLSAKHLDYNKFIEENSDLQTVNNFKKFVERNI